MRVIFLGTPEFAIPSLKTLLGSAHEVCAVFTQPDRPAGRGQKSQAPPVKSVAAGAGLPVYQPEKIRSPENRPIIESFRPDVIVVAAFGQILPPWVLELPRLGCVNVHASLLPRYRGAAPVAWAILNGERVTGITTMLMDEHLDTGPMLLRKEIEISAEVTAGELSAQMAQLGADLVLPTLAGLAEGTIKPIAQDDTMATLAPRITKEMAPIDWNREAAAIHNRVRGLNPWPLAACECRGKRIQVLRSAAPGAATPQTMPAGTFMGVSERGMRVSCGEGTVLEILEVQPAGKRRMPGRDFANGARLRLGEKLGC